MSEPAAFTVIGASGFIGSALVQRLLTDGHERPQSDSLADPVDATISNAEIRKRVYRLTTKP